MSDKIEPDEGHGFFIEAESGEVMTLRLTGATPGALPLYTTEDIRVDCYPADPSVDPLTYVCPKCKADAAQGCLGKRYREPHPERIRAAKEGQEK